MPELRGSGEGDATGATALGEGEDRGVATVGVGDGVGDGVSAGVGLGTALGIIVGLSKGRGIGLNNSGTTVETLSGTDGDTEKVGSPEEEGAGDDKTGEDASEGVTVGVAKVGTEDASGAGDASLLNGLGSFASRSLSRCEFLWR
jgi:hypothetical protein